MVKTFEICAPSLNGGKSALNEIGAYFADKAFPLCIRVHNECPFPLIIPAMRCELNGVMCTGSEGVLTARSLEEMLRFVTSVEQIAFLNQVSHACRMCFVEPSKIEEPADKSGEIEGSEENAKVVVRKPRMRVTKGNQE